MRNLKIIVTVVDKSKKPLEDVAKNTRNAGKAAKQASVDFTQFNKTLFATTAFVGTFLKGFNTLTASLQEGANLDRLTSQFERVMGPKGQLFDSLSQMTDASIDKIEAMRQGLSLGNLGIIRDSTTLASVFAKAGVAAKMAGKESGEGIREYTEFLKTGSVSNLQFLDLIAQSNPALQAQMAILSKAGGVMGTVVQTQARLALGQALLTAATKGQLKGFRDLKDVLTDFKSGFSILRGEIGMLLGKALSPLIDNMTRFIRKASDFIENVRKNHKEIVFLTKALVVGTGAVLGLAGALGTLRLSVIALSSLGLGLPKLIALVAGVGASFIGITKPVDKFVDKLKLFGSFVQGIYQLVTSLDPSTGVAKMDKSIHDLLKKHGLLTLTQNVARFASVVLTTVKDVVAAFKWLAGKVDDIFGGMFTSIKGLLDSFKEPWNIFWVSDSITPIQKFTRAATVILGGFFAWVVGKKAFGMLGGLLSKIPLVGKLFGGGGMGGGPKGTPTDPIWTVNVGDRLKGMAGKIPGMEKLGNIFKGTIDKFKGRLAGLLAGLSMRFDLIKNFIGGIFTRFTGVARAVFAAGGRFIMAGLSRLLSALPTIATFVMRGLAAMAPLLGPALGVAAAAAAGVAVGSLVNMLLDKYTQGETSEGFKGNIVERGLFKMFADKETKNRFKQIKEFENQTPEDEKRKMYEHSQKMGWSKPGETFEDYKKRIAEKEAARMPTIPSGEATAASTPLPDDYQLEMIDILGEELKRTQNSQSLVRQAEIEGALNQGQDLRGIMTPEQQTAAFAAALAGDKNLGVIADHYKRPTIQSNPMTKR